MPNCAVATCNNYTRNTVGKEIKYFRFPRDNDTRKKWINACRRHDIINLKNGNYTLIAFVYKIHWIKILLACICSAHFTPDCFAEPTFKETFLNYQSNKQGLKVDVIPTLNMPGNKRTNNDTTRCNWMAKRRKNNRESIDNLQSISEEFTEVSSEALESSNVESLASSNLLERYAIFYYVIYCFLYNNL